LTFSVAAGPAHGTLSLNANGSFTYTPDANYNGADSFTYKANDGSLDSSVATVNVTVNAVNDAPEVVDNFYSIDEDTTLINANVLTNDTDAENNALSAVLVTGPAHGTLSLNADGSFTYTPDANYNGADSFTYKANDGSLDSSVATVNITVNAVNDAPIASNVALTVAEDTAISGSLSASDVEGDALTFSVAAGPAHGTLSLNANGSFTYTPDANYNGADSFTYKANDGSLDSSVATVNVTVNAVNDAPIASNVALTVAEDTAISGSLSASDVEGDALTFSVAAGPAHGTLSLNANGSFTYTPDANYNGADSFTYKANDGSLDSSVATVNVTVNAVNDAPIASNVALTVAEDTAISGSLSASDVEGDALTFSVAAGPAHGTLSLNANGSFTYTPDANYNGADSFTYKANDGSLDSSVATVNVTVNAVNDAPEVVDNFYSIDEDTTLINANVLTNDTDAENNALSAVLVTGPAHGTLSLNADGSFTYTPDANYNGADSFTYKANDGSLDSSVATVNITVNAVNDAPIASNVALTVAEDTAISGSLSASDVEGDALTFSVAAGPAHGTLSLNANGSFTYTPDANYNGADSFTYKANDGSLDSSVATVNVTVNAVNDAPVAVADVLNLSAAAGSAKFDVSALLANDSDVEDGLPFPFALANIAIQIAEQSSGSTSGGSTSGGGTSGGSTPSDPTSGGAVSGAGAGAGASAGGAVSGTTGGGNGTGDTTGGGTTGGGTVTTEVGGPAITFTPSFKYLDTFVLGTDYTIRDSSNTNILGTIKLILELGVHKLVFTPALTIANDSSQSFNLNYLVKDSDGLVSNSAVVTLNLQGNHTPVAVNDALSDENEAANGVYTIEKSLLLGNDYDVDLNALTINSMTVKNPEGDVIGIANFTDLLNPLFITVTLTNINYTGQVNLEYRVSDGSAISNLAVASFNVINVNDAPIAGIDVISGTQANNAAVTIAVSAILSNDSDVDSSLSASNILIKDADNAFHQLSSTSAIAVTNGSVVLDGVNLVFTPTDASVSGEQTIVYKLNDGASANNLSNVVDITFDIAAQVVNHAPVAVADTISGTQANNAAVTIAVSAILGNDSDVDNTLSASNIYIKDADNVFHQLSTTAIAVSNGSVVLNGDNLVFTPTDSGVSGDISLTYKLNDGALDSNQSSITFTMANSGLVANNDLGYNYNEDQVSNNISKAVITGYGGFYEPSILGNDIVPDFKSVQIRGGTPDSMGDVYFGNYEDGNTIGFASYVESWFVYEGVTYFMMGSDIKMSITDQNYYGEYKIDYRLVDNFGNYSNWATISGYINPVNDDPVALNPTIHSDEDTILEINSSLLASDVDSNAINITSVSFGNVFDSAKGSLAIIDNKIVFTPTYQFSGTVSVSYSVSDGISAPVNGVVTIVVDPINDAPVTRGNPVELQVNDGGQIVLSASLLAIDEENDDMVITSVNGQAIIAGQSQLILVDRGTINISANGEVIFNTDVGYAGHGSQFNFTVVDSHGGSSNGVVLIKETLPTNIAPVAHDDSFVIDEDTNIIANLLNNDVELNNGDVLHVVSFSVNGSSYLAGNVATLDAGTLNIDSMGNISFVPTLNYNGQVPQISYVTSDNQGATDSAIVSVAINSVYDYPIANPDVGNSIMESDLDSHFMLTTGFTALPPFGILFPQTQDLGDKKFLIAQQSLGSNYWPSIMNNDFYENPNASVEFSNNIYGSNSQVSIGTTVIRSEAVNLGLGVISNHNLLIASLYDNNYNGEYHIDYRINDGGGHYSNWSTISGYINPVNDAPVANATALTVAEDTVLTITGAMLATDVDGNPLSITGVSSTNITDGTLSLSGGVVTFTPNANFYGAAGSATFTVSDGNGGEISVTKLITVTPVNDAPVAFVDNLSVNDDVTALSANLLANDTDVDIGDTKTLMSVNNISLSLSGVNYLAADALTLAGSGLSYTITANTGYGNPDSATLVFNSDGSFTLTPNGALDMLPADATLTISGNYTMQDNGLPTPEQSSSTFSIVVNGFDNNDVFTGNSSDNVIIGGDGTDTMKFDGIENAVSLTLNASGASATGQGSDSFTSVESFVGSNLSDTIIIGSSATVDLDAGTVTINGSPNIVYSISGFENVTGSSGPDTIISNSLDNILSGAGSADFVSYQAAVGTEDGAGVTINLNLANQFVSAGSTNAGADTLSNFERVIGSNYDDVIIGNNSASSNTINGLGGFDQFRYDGVALAVTLTMNLASTSSTGQGPDSTTDVESFVGSSLVDTIVLGSAGTVNLAAGSVIINGTTNTTYTISGFENVTGSAGDDSITGNSGNNVIDGGAGTDTVSYAAAGSAVTVNFSSSVITVTGAAVGTDTLQNIENVIAAGNPIVDIINLTGAGFVTLGGATNIAKNGSKSITFSGFDTINGNGTGTLIMGIPGSVNLIGGSVSYAGHNLSGFRDIGGSMGDDTITNNVSSSSSYGEYVSALTFATAVTFGNDSVSSTASISTSYGEYVSGSTFAAAVTFGNDSVFTSLTTNSATTTSYGEYVNASTFAADVIFGSDGTISSSNTSATSIGDYAGISTFNGTVTFGSDGAIGNVQGANVYGDYTSSVFNNTVTFGNDKIIATINAYGDYVSGASFNGNVTFGNDTITNTSTTGITAGEYIAGTKLGLNAASTINFGADTININATSTQVYGEYLQASAQSINGTIRLGADTIIGDANAQTIYGDYFINSTAQFVTTSSAVIYMGDDVITGGGGNDIMWGESYGGATFGANITLNRGSDTFVFTLSGTGSAISSLRGLRPRQSSIKLRFHDKCVIARRLRSRFKHFLDHPSKPSIPRITSLRSL
jgi:VCBS repeat-containing protein